MAQTTTHKLRAQTVKTLTEPGLYSDGGGLYLHVTDRQRSWTFIYVRDKRRRQMGLGGADDTALAVARQKAQDARDLLARGLDPLEVRRVGKPRVGIPTFGEMADQVIAAKAVAWKGGKQRNEWERTLSRQRDKAGKQLRTGDCLSLIGKPVDAITTEDVRAVLAPMWESKQTTGMRTRSRIEAVLDAAKAAGHRTGDNPAAWKGNLKTLLGAIDYSVEGHKAMPYRRLPAFMVRLRSELGIAARCLEFVILTAARSAEARGAMWSEIDLEGRCWTVPAERMKMGKLHAVPLSDRAVAILRDLEAIWTEGGDGLIFPSGEGTPVHNETMKGVLLRLTDDGSTIHGFRSTFSDWANDETPHAADVIENALAHRAKGVRGSYRRATAYDKRVGLMAAWGAYCAGKPAKAVQAPARPGRHVRLRRLPIRRLRPATAALEAVPA